MAALASSEGTWSQSSLLAAVSANILLFDPYADIEGMYIFLLKMISK